MLAKNTLKMLKVLLCLAIVFTGPATAFGQEDYDTFLELLNAADQIVRQSYPDAIFYEADLDLEKAGSGWVFVFRVPPSKGTVYLRTYLGHFQLPPTFTSHLVYDDRGIDVSTIHLGLPDAIRIAQQHDCGGNVRFITLRFILYPGVTEPTYILTMPEQNKRAFVDVYPPFDVKCQPISN